uniref:Uncharacterized protein n=1 Tax=Anguilla anguilla TaxID=7936 RepID=A0A0E9U561_ANGAN
MCIPDTYTCSKLWKYFWCFHIFMCPCNSFTSLYS